jgi:hypothetical protein
LHYVNLHKFVPNFHLLVKWPTDVGIYTTKLVSTLTACRNMHGKLLSQQEKADRVAVITASLEDSEAPHTNDESLRADEDHKRKEELWGFVTYRQSFVTKSGKLGLEPRGMDVYDDIVVLWGEQCLIVARKAEHGQWTMKGECFVEEWVQGGVVNVLVQEEEKRNVIFEFV